MYDHPEELVSELQLVLQFIDALLGTEALLLGGVDYAQTGGALGLGAAHQVFWVRLPLDLENHINRLLSERVVIDIIIL